MVTNKKSPLNRFIPIYILFFIIAVFALREFTIVGNITSIHSWIGDPELFYKVYVQPYSWNTHLTRPESVIQFLARLFYLPFTVISKLFGISMFRVLPWIYVFSFSLAGFSMFYLVFYFIRNYKNPVSSYIPSFLAGLCYMSYPFFAIGELTEIFVIFGFSVFPLVIFYFIKGIKEKSCRHVVLSVILGTYSAFWDVRYLFLSFIIYISYTIYYFFINKFQKYYFKKILRIWIILLTVFTLFGGVNLFVFASKQSEAVSVPLNKESYLITWKEGTPIKLFNGFSWFLLPEQIDWNTTPIPEKLHQILALVPPILAASLFIWKRRYSPKEIYYFGLLLALTLVLFSSKSFIDWLVTESPYNLFIGRMFRTPRIPAQLIAISVCLLFGLSVERIVNITVKKGGFLARNVMLPIIVIMILSSIIITSFPFFVYGTITGWFTPFTPSPEYKEINSILQNMDTERTIWFPSPPFSAPVWYTPKSGKSYFYIYNSKAPTVWPAFNRWVYFIDFVLSSKYSLLREGNIESLASILSNAGINYIIISNETHYPQSEINRIIENLNKSKNFEVVFSNKKYYIYKIVTENTSEILIKSPYIIGGGLKSLDSLAIIKPTEKYSALLLDDRFSPSVIRIARVFILPPYANNMDLLIYFIDRHYIYPPAEYNKGGARYLTGPHHGEWHSYMWKFSHRYEFSYNINYGFFTFEKINEIETPIKIYNNSKYIIFARILKSNKGGELIFSINNFSKVVKTYDPINDAKFVWVKIGEVNLSKGIYNLEVKGFEGEKAINILVLVPEGVYIKAKEEVEKLLRNKTVIHLFEGEADLYRSNIETVKDINASNGELLVLSENGKAWQDVEIVKNGTYRLALKGVGEFKVRIGDHEFILKSNSLNFTYTPLFYLTKGKYRLEIIPLNVKNLVKNPSFEEVSVLLNRNLIKNPSFENISLGSPENWSIGNSKDFNISFDDGYEGNYSLKISTNLTERRWSWIRSEPIDVEPGKEYLIVTHMKVKNANASHIPIEGYFANKNQWKQLGQIPPGVKGTGTYDWQEFRWISKIPENVTKIRVVLNAGWVLNESKGEAVTWFDDIKVFSFVPLNSVSNNFIDPDIKLLEDWIVYNTKSFRIDTDKGHEGNYSLKVSTNSTKEKTWSWIRSEPIDVEPEKEYLIITHMKIKNANASHIPIEGYFVNEKRWKQLGQIPPGITGTGTFDWKEFSWTLKIPENVTKIRVVLNAGWVLNESKGEAVTWFDDIEVIPFEEAPKLDVIWLYSTETNQTIDQLFQVNETPANVTSYTKINPTLWKVKVNAKKPFMLSFAESYDPLWEARIYKNGKIVKKIKPVPLYGVINGFWINETGNLSIEIRYTPQDWFEIGLWISGATFMGCVGYIFYDWMKDRKLKGRNARKKGCGKEKRKR